MAKIPEAQMNAQLEEIVRQINAGYTDLEIMKNLNVKRQTFYDYKQKIFKRFGDIAAKKTDATLEFEADLLKDRYNRLFRNLELSVTDPSANLGDKALASEVAAFIATNIFKLEVEGLRARQGRKLQQNEQKAIRYIGALQPRLSEPDYTPTPGQESDDDEESKDPSGESKAD